MQGQRKRPLSKDEGSLMPKQLHLDDSSQEEEDPLMTLNTPDSQLTTCAHDDQVSDDQPGGSDNNKPAELEEVQPMEEEEESVGGVSTNLPIVDKDSGSSENEPSEVISKMDSNEDSEDRGPDLFNQSSAIFHDHAYSQLLSCSSFSPTTPAVTTVTSNMMLTPVSHLEMQDMFSSLTCLESNSQDNISMETGIVQGIDKGPVMAVEEAEKNPLRNSNPDKTTIVNNMMTSNNIAEDSSGVADANMPIGTDESNEVESDQSSESPQLSTMAAGTEGSERDVADSAESNCQSRIASFSQLIKEIVEQIKHSNALTVNKNELDELLEQCFDLTRAVYFLNGR